MCTAESPKLTIAKNMMLLKELSHAKTEADLQKAYDAPMASVNLSALPAELEGLSAYFSTDSVSSAEPYIPDPTAWQNKNFGAFAWEECQRAETWPFVVSLIICNIVMIVAHVSAPKEGRKDSPYLQLLESHEGAYQKKLEREAHH